MDDEGTGGGPALDRINLRDSFGIKGIGAKSVDGFSGEGYQPAGAEKTGGAGDFGGVDG